MHQPHHQGLRSGAEGARISPPDMPLHRLACFANGKDVATVMVDGEIVLQDGHVLRVNGAEIRSDAAERTALMIAGIGGAADLALPSGFRVKEGERP